MSEIPSSWVTAPLGAFTLDCGQRVPQENEEFKYIDIGSINRETKRIETPQLLHGQNAPSRARKQVKAGDVLVSMTRPNLNAVALVPDEFDGQIASTGFDVLRTSLGIEPRWISYLVRSSAFVEAMSDLVQGALYPAVRPRDIRGYEAPLAPLNEQKRIADKLDAVLARVDACRDRIDRIPSILKRFRQSVLSAATSGKLTEDWRSARQLPAQATVLLGDCCDVLGGKRLPKGFELTEQDTGFPYVRVTDFAAFSVKLKQLKFVPPEAAALISRYIINSDDIYISIAGSIGLVGQVPQKISGSNLTENAARIVIRHSFIPRFLMYQLASPALQDQMQEKKIATTQDKLGLFRIKELELLSPSADEQTEIVRRVESLFAYADRLEACRTAARTQVEILTPATLAKAFRGELVPQDPNDEPASALLERIRSARTESVVKPKRAQTIDSVYVPRKLKEKSNMTKSRQDEDVSGKPYLAAHLRKLGGAARVEILFNSSELPVTDFYKQLAWEVSKSMVRDAGETLELGDAA